jgi:hypothetical protein
MKKRTVLVAGGKYRCSGLKEQPRQKQKDVYVYDKFKIF